MLALKWEQFAPWHCQLLFNLTAEVIVVIFSAIIDNGECVLVCLVKQIINLTAHCLRKHP